MGKRLVFGRYDYGVFIAFMLYAACTSSVPVALVALSNDLGFHLESGGMSAGGALHLARSVPLVLSLLLSGFFAGRFGLVNSIGACCLIMGSGIMLASLSPVYGMFFLSAGIMGFGAGVVEGLGTPLIQNLHTKDTSQYINFAHSFWGVGMLVSVITMGALLTLGVHWRVVLFSTGAFTIIPALIFLYPTKKSELKKLNNTTSLRKVFSNISEVLRKKRFWIFVVQIFFIGGGEFCLAFWSASYIQLNFASSAFMGGLGTALFAAGMFISRMTSGILVKQEKIFLLLLGCVIASLALSLLFWYISNLYLFMTFLLLAGLTVGPLWPTAQIYCVERLNKHDSTTIFILLSAVGSLGCGFFTWSMGFVSDLTSFKNSFLLVPFCFFMAIVLLFIERVLKMKNLL